MTNQTAPLVICLQPRVCSVGVGSPEHHPSHGHLAQSGQVSNLIASSFHNVTMGAEGAQLWEAYA